MIVAVSSGLERRHGQVRCKGFCYGSKVNFNISRLMYSFSQMSYRVFNKYCVFFPRIFESVQPLPRQHSPAIGCTKNYQPIGVTVHSHCVESFEGLLQSCG